MWYEDLPENATWASLWHDYVRCRCPAIRRLDRPCPACGDPVPSFSESVFSVEGKSVKVPANVFAGGENRYEDWVYLMMLEREWNRALTDADYLPHVSPSAKPSPRASVILVFWSYFETRINRLVEETTRPLPGAVRQDLLNRHSHVGSRLERLYKILFGTTYWSDLSNVGYANIADLLQSIQHQRNKFVHGHPAAIDDKLVRRLVELLREEHEAWIAVFNFRVAKGLESSV